MNKRYQWFEISEDGLLRLPKDVGPYWDSDNINGKYDAYKTEEAALAGADAFIKRQTYVPYARLVLMAVFTRQ